MAVPNRTTIINKLQKVLKKHYKPFHTPDMSVVDTLIYACCLENAFPDAAEVAFQNLKAVSFDLNELRVTTVGELGQVVKMLPHPKRAAYNLKRLLQSVFESQYSYDLEHLRKLKLGQVNQLLQKFEGSTPFVVSFVVQNTLGGHAIPIDRGTLECLYIVGIIDDQEKQSWLTPGLERAIPKNRGREFFSLLHQLGAELTARPFGPTIKSMLLEISPDAKDRFPKRASRKKKAEQPVAVPEPEQPSSGAKSKKPSRGKTAQPAAEVAKKGKPSDAAAAAAAAKKVVNKKATPPPEKKKTKANAKKGTPAAKKPTKPGGKTHPPKRITRRKPK